MQQSKLLINFIFILFLLLGCQGEDLIEDRVDPEIRVLENLKGIELEDGRVIDIELTLGDDKAIDLAYFDIVGNRIKNPKFTWASSDENVLTVSSEGIIKAVGGGEATITVSIQTFEDITLTRTFNIRVNVKPKLQIITDVSSILKGDQLNLEFNLIDSDSGEAIEPETIKWLSTNDQAITVDKNGKITGVEVGRSTITLSVTFNNETITQEIVFDVVVSPELIIKTNGDTTITPNQTLTLNSVFHGLDGQPVNGVEISYMSSNTNIITVDINGKVTAISNGVAEITGMVTFDGDSYEDSISFTVLLEPKITLSETISVITEGDSLKINATFFDEHGEENSDVTFTWKTTNAASLNVEQDGTISAIQAEGSVIVTVTVQYNGETYTNEFPIEIKAKSIEPVLKITQKPNTLEHDAEYKVEFTFTNQLDDQAIQPDEPAQWKSDDIGVVSVDDNGNLSAQGEGSTIITVSIVYNGQTFEDSFSVRVMAENQTIPVDPVLTVFSSLTDLEVDQESTVSFRFFNKVNDQTIEPDTFKFNWSSSDSDIISLEGNGKIVAQKEGSATIQITVNYLGQRYTQSVEIKVSAPSTEIEIEPQINLNSFPSSLEEDQESQASFEFVNKTNNQALQPESITWISSDTDVATIDNNGNVIAKSEGSTTITITIVYNGQSYNDTFSLKVTAKPIVVKPELSLTSSPSSLKKGNESQLNYSFIDKTNNQALNPQSISWQSGNENVVSVNRSGLVTAVNPGTTTITLTTNYDGQSYTNSFSIRVWIDPVISITSTLKRIEKDDTETLSFDYFDDQGQKQSSQTVTWTSSDTGIISVDSNGMITAKKVGQATIRIRTQLGSSIYSDTITIDVYVEPTLSISNPTSDIVEGTSYDFNFDFTGEDGQSATPDSVTWNSSDTDVLTIDNDGVVTTVSTGTSTITVTVTYQNQSYSENFNFSVNADSNTNQNTERFTGSISGSYGLKGSYEVSADGDDLLIELKDDFSINNSLPDGALYLTNASQRITGTVKQIWRGRSHYNGPRTYRVENTGLKEFQYIVIWCVNFNVHVGTTKLFDN